MMTQLFVPENRVQLVLIIGNRFERVDCTAIAITFPKLIHGYETSGYTPDRYTLDSTEIGKSLFGSITPLIALPDNVQKKHKKGYWNRHNSEQLSLFPEYMLSKKEGN